MIEAGDFGHITHSNQSKRRLDSAIYSEDYDTLQDAIDAAVGGTPAEGVNGLRWATRPLIIKPGVYIVEPLRFYGVHGLHIFAYGAILQIEDNADVIVDMAGCIQCSIQGLSVAAIGSATAQIGFKLAEDAAKASIGATQVRLINCAVGGRYVTGYQIGEGNAQCDSMSLYHCVAGGGWMPGEEVLWQYGLRVGDSSWGNNLQHSAYSFYASHNRYQVAVLASELGLFGGGFSYCESDFLLGVASYATIEGIRSEGAERLLESSGAGAYPANVSLRDILWNAQNIAEDGRYVVWHKPGTLIMDNISVQGAPADITPSIHSTPFNPLSVLMRGFSLQGVSSIEDAFDVGGNVYVHVEGFAQVDEFLHASTHVADWRNW